MHENRRFTLAFVLLIGFMLSGCATVVDSVVDGAVSGVGRAAYKRAEQAVYKSLAPKEELPPPTAPGWGYFMAAQAQIIFSYAFTAGGYWPADAQFQSGEWTKFQVSDNESDDSFIIERALLKRLEDGREWWRVAWKQGEEEWIYEGLIDPEQGQLQRLRGQDTEGNSGEIPIQETPVYTSPTELSEESLEGATQGTERLSTPAGTFETTVIKYMNPSAGGTIKWWTSDEVPGDVVQYQTLENGEAVWTSTLSSKGADATTKLESF